MLWNGWNSRQMFWFDVCGFLIWFVRIKLYHSCWLIDWLIQSNVDLGQVYKNKNRKKKTVWKVFCIFFLLLLLQIQMRWLLQIQMLFVCAFWRLIIQFAHSRNTVTWYTSGSGLFLNRFRFKWKSWKKSTHIIEMNASVLELIHFSPLFLPETFVIHAHLVLCFCCSFYFVLFNAYKSRWSIATYRNQSHTTNRKWREKTLIIKCIQTHTHENKWTETEEKEKKKKIDALPVNSLIAHDYFV